MRINNRTLSALVNRHGAELTALMRSGTDYLWSGDARVWGQISPLLFPIVGRQIGDSYSYNGKNYHMPRHGFAMDMDFEFSNQTDSSVELSFSSSSESGPREIYPFDFSLRSVFSFENDTLIDSTADRLEHRRYGNVLFARRAHRIPPSGRERKI